MLRQLTVNTTVQISGSSQNDHMLFEFLETKEHLMLAPGWRHIPKIQMLRNSIFFPCIPVSWASCQCQDLHWRHKQEQIEDHIKVTRWGYWLWECYDWHRHCWVRKAQMLLKQQLQIWTQSSTQQLLFLPAMLLHCLMRQVRRRQLVLAKARWLTIQSLQNKLSCKCDNVGLVMYKNFYRLNCMLQKEIGVLAFARYLELLKVSDQRRRKLNISW